jgi:predicted ATP-binding protein involved in virulence
MKLRSLHIQDYKVFKNFDIDFLDSEDKPLPIVVLAGVNGSGKTTLLETIYNVDVKNTQIDILINKKMYDSFSNVDGISNLTHVGYVPILEKEKKDSLYFSAGQDDTKKVADEFVKSFYFFLKEKDYRPSEVKEHFHQYMISIFENIDLTFKYSHLDRDDNVWFINNEGKEFEIKDLSIGEKTLLSKIMYLYFLDYKNKVILIDEPELSLHPSWQNKVLKIYENFAKLNNCQIIIATHSPHIIGSAKNEYLRILRKDDEGKIEVIKDILSYGRDIEWVLEEVMGTQYTREKNILNKIEECHDLIDAEKYDEADEAINNLEVVIGENDSEILTLRNNLAFERIDFEEDN